MVDINAIDTFQNKRVLVTGGTGLIGRKVAELLSSMGAAVTVVSLDNINLDNGFIRHIHADIREHNVCIDVTRNMDSVFHLAGVKGSIEVTKSHPASFFVPLLQFNTNMLEACRVNGVKRVVYTSSIGAYPSAELFVEGEIADGVPMDFYAGWAKRVAEMQIEAYRIQYNSNNFVVVRPCNVYGEGDNFDPDNAMVIPSLIYRAIHDPVVKVWGDGSAIRDFAYSEDIAEGIILAAHFMPQVPYLNLGSGMEYTVKELVETLNEVIPFEFEWDTTKPSGFPKRVMDISLAKNLIQYEPTTTLKEGLIKTVEWYKNHQQQYLNRLNYFKQ